MHGHVFSIIYSLDAGFRSRWNRIIIGYNGDGKRDGSLWENDAAAEQGTLHITDHQ